MDKIIKINTQSSGRDKIFRLVQYTSKLIWGALENRNGNQDLIKKLKDLEYNMSTGRKLYRFGRGVDTLYTALNSLNLNEPALRYTVSFSRINFALFLLADHVVWLGRTGLFQVDKTKWARLSYKFWLYYLVVNLLRDLYEIKRVLGKLNYGGHNHELHGFKPKMENTLVGKARLVYRAMALHKEVVLDTLKNGCDVCLPLSLLGYLSLSPTTIGLLGLTSSLAGILPLVDPSFKLAP